MELHNTYWTLRHGQSKANFAGIIVSTLENGVKEEFGLTEAGRLQAAAAGELLKESVGPELASELQIHASPFSRTIETACCAAAAAGLRSDNNRSEVVPELRERNFGAYELQSHDNYASVWLEDAKSPDYKPPGGGESVREVADRLKTFLARVEGEHRGKSVLLVAHGDTLSILQAVVKGTPLEAHRNVALNTGELRMLYKAKT